MGQRHQIFIRIANPIKHMRGLGNKDTKLASLKKQLGNGDTCILAFHHQWLYGRSALANAVRILKFGSQFTTKQKLTKDGYEQAPFLPNYMQWYVDELREVTDALAFIMNYQATDEPWLKAGLNRGCFYIGETDGNINHDFTMGDNNDGITIIDLVNNKYCFMNPFESYSTEDGELHHSASDLPTLKPCSAHDYVDCYYGEKLDTCNPYYLKDKTAEEQAKIIEDNIKTNAMLVKRFKKFKILTLAEIDKMFPKMKLLKKKTAAVK